MIDIKRDKKKYIMTFNNDDIPNNLIEKLMRKSEIDKILDKNKLTEKDIFELSDKIKKDWWEDNKKWILDKIDEKEEKSNN